MKHLELNGQIWVKAGTREFMNDNVEDWAEFFGRIKKNRINRFGFDPIQTCELGFPLPEDV